MEYPAKSINFENNTSANLYMSLNFEFDFRYLDSVEFLILKLKSFIENFLFNIEILLPINIILIDLLTISCGGH